MKNQQQSKERATSWIITGDVGIEGQDAVVEMPTTPEQLERMIATRVTAALASKGLGNILNISSVATRLATAPRLAVLF